MNSRHIEIPESALSILSTVNPASTAPHASNTPANARYGSPEQKLPASFSNHGNRTPDNGAMRDSDPYDDAEFALLTIQNMRQHLEEEAV